MSCVSVSLTAMEHSFLILGARPIRAPHQDEPRIGKRRGGGRIKMARAVFAAPDDDTNARYRTESQSFVRRALNILNARLEPDSKDNYRASRLIAI